MDRMIKICILSQQHFRNKHVSEDTVDAFENAIITTLKNDAIVKKINISELNYKLNRKFKGKLDLIDYKTIKNVNTFHPDIIFIMSMSPAILYYQKSTLARLVYPKMVYCIDTWETRNDEWKRSLKGAIVDSVVCSNARSVDVFRKFIDKVEYLPYSMNQKYFYPRDIVKTHLFMQMGRKNNTLHDWCLRYIKEHNLEDSFYVRERERGQVIYPDFRILADEISKTWFFIVSPRDVDESNVTGAISDVTARYYEGMACKTLLVGYKPKDTFDNLFPQKDAMIEVSSYHEFCEQVDFYLNNKNVYNDVVNLNYDFLIGNHTWNHRAKQLLNYIFEIVNKEN